MKVLYCKSSTNHCDPFLKYPRRDTSEPRNLVTVVNLGTSEPGNGSEPRNTTRLIWSGEHGGIYIA